MEILHEKFLGHIRLPIDRPFLIAEAGVNHENNIHVALRMVEEAASAGADAIKFQSYKAERLASRYSPAYWDTKKESTKNQYDLFRKYDHFGDDEYITLAEKAKSVGIYFLSTPFDIHYADLLEGLMPFYKIASADITNTILLRHCAKKGKPLLLSTGASTLAEIDQAINIAKEEGNEQIALFHCVLSYPCNPKDANLATITYLNNVYPNLVIGYSDHVPPSVQGNVLTTAWLLGARIIEKHFTLDKTKTGNDHYHAMDSDDLRLYRAGFEYAFSLIGDETKKIMPCELEARKQARRSLVAGRNIGVDEIIQKKDIEIKRPGTGIEPQYLDIVVGLKTTCAIKQDEILQWNMFSARQDG